MPNWCSNGVTISHTDPFKIKFLVDAMREGNFCNHAIPVPKMLYREGSSTHGGPNAEDYDRIRAENLAATGYESWYDFCSRNWGTKWDVTCDALDVSEDGLTVTASFESAWAPPVPVYEALEAEGFTVTAYYNEPGMAFVGKYAEGYDECIEYAGTDSKTVVDTIGEELDEYFGISESMAMWEEDEVE